MIYKTFFGKHIDLSKVISISDVILDTKTIYDNLSVEIECMLLERPIVYSEYFKRTRSNQESIEQLNGTLPQFVEMVDGTIKNSNQVDFKEIKQVYELQLKINELIEVWKKSQDSGNDIYLERIK